MCSNTNTQTSISDLHRVKQQTDFKTVLRSAVKCCAPFADMTSNVEHLQLQKM